MHLLVDFNWNLLHNMEFKGFSLHEHPTGLNASDPIHAGSSNIYKWSGNTTEADFLAITMLITGPVICFYGFKAFRAALAIVSAVLSAYSCYILVSTYTEFTASMEYIVVFTAGLAGALAALTVLDLGIFLLGAAFGGLLSNVAFHTFYQNLNIKENEALVRCLLLLSCCLVCGLLALYCLRFLIKIFTAAIGSYMIVAALSHISLRLGIFPTSPYSPQFFFNTPDKFQCTGAGTRLLAICYGFGSLWIILFICGLIMQLTAFKSTNGNEFRDKDYYEEIKLNERERKTRQEQSYGLLTDAPTGRSDYQSTAKNGRPITQHVV
jgi:hypothetical protein